MNRFEQDLLERMEARLQRGDKPIKYLTYKPASYEPKSLFEKSS